MIILNAKTIIREILIQESQVDVDKLPPGATMKAKATARATYLINRLSGKVSKRLVISEKK